MTINGFKNRTFSVGDKVRVYRNLNNGKWSIQAATGEYKGKVVGHLDHLTLNNVKFNVSKAGRARILKEKRKNVCAYAIGDLHSIEAPEKFCDQHIEVTFNPYKTDFFCFTHDVTSQVDELEELSFIDGKAFIPLFTRALAL